MLFYILWGCKDIHFLELCKNNSARKWYENTGGRELYYKYLFNYLQLFTATKVSQMF